VHLCRDARGQATISWKGPYVARPDYALSPSLTFRDLDVNQFSIITELLGTPPDDVIETICSENVCKSQFLLCSLTPVLIKPGFQTLRFVQSLPKRQRVPFSEKLRCNDESALDLLEKMLVFDPRKRINATECLSHEYVAPYHDPTDEPVAAEKFDWSFNDADLPVDTWKVMMYAEILGARSRL
jgi:p38 MAP kinase